MQATGLNPYTINACARDGVHTRNGILVHVYLFCQHDGSQGGLHRRKVCHFYRDNVGTRHLCPLALLPRQGAPHKMVQEG